VVAGARACRGRNPSSRAPLVASAKTMRARESRLTRQAQRLRPQVARASRASSLQTERTRRERAGAISGIGRGRRESRKGVSRLPYLPRPLLGGRVAASGVVHILRSPHSVVKQVPSVIVHATAQRAPIMTLKKPSPRSRIESRRIAEPVAATPLEPHPARRLVAPRRRGDSGYPTSCGSASARSDPRPTYGPPPPLESANRLFLLDSHDRSRPPSCIPVARTDCTLRAGRARSPRPHKRRPRAALASRYRTREIRRSRVPSARRIRGALVDDVNYPPRAESARSAEASRSIRSAGS
jgi:hypothetical protein